ncbi:sigma-70 family RNA polymerase sigma factor [Planctomicrobium piriforme]|uniref:RNA polymerase sigma-70 factor, ECF subfamily n=1 Tax=Planctomicrobium piriforme TaxID=1576369 RepID=A0A1I3H1D2_9PLAN|nr:sigma-70 family RNA polymerase sigma factor [Planctomicrobium piriforme]SFI29436.1 RNA polymerase sigma-70 factor, ECF subfamily [Planctomicrobium piriforme]
MPDLQPQERHQKFLRLFTTHEPAIRAFVRRLVPSRADADDVLQEVAIVLWDKFDEFREDGDFRAWAYGIARFKVLSRLRDISRDRIVLSTDVVEMIAESSLEDEFRLQRERDVLENCFKKVSPKNRDLLAQAYQPDAKIQEVAAQSGRTVGGFYQWLYRMRSMLLECIQRELAREAVS